MLKTKTSVTTEMKKTNSGAKGSDLKFCLEYCNLHKSKHDKDKKRCKSRRTLQRFQAAQLFEWDRRQLGDHFTRFLPLQLQLVCRRLQELAHYVHCTAPVVGLY